MNRKINSVLFLIASLFISFSATASFITYTVNRTFDSGPSAQLIGTIVTDGTIGVITGSNIIDFTLTGIDSEMGPNHPQISKILGGGYAVSSGNSILKATATELYVDTSLGFGLEFFEFRGAIGFDPYGGGHDDTYMGYTLTLSNLEGLMLETLTVEHGGFGAGCGYGCSNNYQLPAENLVFATAPGTPPRDVPEPGTLALLSVSLIGIGLIRRRQKA